MQSTYAASACDLCMRTLPVDRRRVLDTYLMKLGMGFVLSNERWAVQHNNGLNCKHAVSDTEQTLAMLNKLLRGSD